MIIGILREPESENRVAMLPGEVAGLIKLGVEVIVEQKAGEKAFVSDKEYQTAGASIFSRNEVIIRSELLLSVNPLLKRILNLSGKDRCFVPLVNPCRKSGMAGTGTYTWTNGACPRPGSKDNKSPVDGYSFIYGYCCQDIKLYLQQLQFCQDSFRCSCRLPEQ